MNEDRSDYSPKLQYQKELKYLSKTPIDNGTLLNMELGSFDTDETTIYSGLPSETIAEEPKQSNNNNKNNFPSYDS